MNHTWEARNRFGRVVATFGARDLAESYRDRMAAIGTAITLARVVVARRAA